MELKPDNLNHAKLLCLIDAEYNKINATKNYIISVIQLKADIAELSLKDLYIWKDTLANIF